jgi:hypothetical protein
VGRVASLTVAANLGLISLGTMAAGVLGIVANGTQRDSSGYLMTSAERYATSTYALVSASYRGGTSGDALVPRDVLGTVRVRIQSVRPVFVGIAPEASVDAYLANVARAQGASFAVRGTFNTYRGVAPVSSPSSQRFWSASAVGAGSHTLGWVPKAGNWRVVVMNADASNGRQRASECPCALAASPDDRDRLAGSGNSSDPSRRHDAPSRRPPGRIHGPEQRLTSLGSKESEDMPATIELTDSRLVVHVAGVERDLGDSPPPRGMACEHRWSRARPRRRSAVAAWDTTRRQHIPGVITADGSPYAVGWCSGTSMILTRQSGSLCEASATSGSSWKLDDPNGDIARIRQAAGAVAA